MPTSSYITTEDTRKTEDLGRAKTRAQLPASVLQSHLWFMLGFKQSKQELAPGLAEGVLCSFFPIKELCLSHSNQSTALLALWDLFLATEQPVCRTASALARGRFWKACCSRSEIAGHLLCLARFTGTHSCGWKRASFCISSTETKPANLQIHQKILPC